MATWRIDTRRMHGRKAEPVVLLELSEADHERLLEAVQDQ